METNLTAVTAAQPQENATPAEQAATKIAAALVPATPKAPAPKKAKKAAAKPAADPMAGHELTTYPNTTWVWLDDQKQPVGIWHGNKKAHLLPKRVAEALKPAMLKALRTGTEIDPRKEAQPIKVSFRPDFAPWWNVKIVNIVPMTKNAREAYAKTYGDVTAKVLDETAEFKA